MNKKVSPKTFSRYVAIQALYNSNFQNNYEINSERNKEEVTINIEEYDLPPPPPTQNETRQIDPRTRPIIRSRRNEYFRMFASNRII